MTQLVAALSDPGPNPPPPRHFLLPRPPAVADDDPQLFGFWTYEVRVGHAGTRPPDWSTAQAR